MIDARRIIICFLIICVIGGIIGYVVYLNNQGNDEFEVNTIQEYIPQEEISDIQARQTMVSLYFKSDKDVIPEARFIDVKLLIDNPYNVLVDLLIKGPKNETLKNTIPKGTILNSVERQGETLIIDFSKEFVENHIGGEEEEMITIKSIVNTLTELTEINGISIKIDGEINKSFKDGMIKFDKIFYRE